jgi:Peptidase M50B-like
MDAKLPAAHAPLPGTQVPLPGPVAALVGLAALAIVLIPTLWRLADHLDTMAHEGAHAVVGSTMGFPVRGVTMDAAANGATDVGPGNGPRMLLTSFVGYLGPSAFGLCAAKLISTGRVVTVLWVATILLVLLLFLVRRSFGIVSVPLALALLALSMRYAHEGLQEVISYGLTWLLLLSGVRTATAHGTGAGDAWFLAETTHLPRRLWALLWIAGTLLAVVVGGKWLVLRS